MGKNNKNKQPERTPQENEQIETIRADYNEIATNLAKSRNEEQVVNALSPIFDMTAAAQLGLLKALAKERSTRAADIVLAINTYAPIKEVRKEARRALIQLEGANTYPEWTIPSVMSLSDIVGLNALSDFEGDDEDYEEDDDFESDENTIERFLRYWGQGDFALSYDLLTVNSPLKEGLSREDWAGRRRIWAEEAGLKTGSIQVDVGYTLEAEEEDLPAELVENGAEELDAFWSIELRGVQSNNVPELPTATLVLEATGRHWFWAAYTFLTEDGELRIHSIRDKGAEALHFSQSELEEHSQEIVEELQAIMKPLAHNEDADASDEDEIEDEESDEEELEVDYDEIRWFSKQLLHYCDALIKHVPEVATLYEVATKQATTIQEIERSAAYLTLAAEHVPDERADILRSLGETYTILATEDMISYLEEEELEESDDAIPAEFTSRYFPLAEGAFRDSLAIDHAFSTYILMADLFVGQNKHVDEAKSLFGEAEALAENDNQRAAIALGRAKLAQQEENPEEALAQYHHAIDLAPDVPTVWNSIGTIQLSLGQRDAAEESFLKSIEVNPTVAEAYGELATLYVERNEDTAAIRVLEQGLDANPGSVDVMASLAMLYVNQGDLQKAEELITEAEEIDPNMEIVEMIRQIIDLTKLQMQQPQRSDSKSNKSKKRR